MASGPTLHDMMVQMRAYVLGQYNMPLLCAALRVKPGVWMPLRHMTQEEFTKFEQELCASDEYPHVYEARHVGGMSEVRSRVLKRKARTVRAAPIEDWEIDPSILRGSGFTA